MISAKDTYKTYQTASIRSAGRAASSCRRAGRMERRQEMAIHWKDIAGKEMTPLPPGLIGYDVGLALIDRYQQKTMLTEMALRLGFYLGTEAGRGDQIIEEKKTDQEGETMTAKQIEKDFADNPKMLKASQAIIDLNKSNPDAVDAITREVQTGKNLVQAVQAVSEKRRA